MFTNDPFEDFGFGFTTPFSSPYAYESRRRQAELARRQRLDAERRRQLELERRRQFMERERAKEEQRRRELEMMRRQQLIEKEEMRREKAAAQKRRARTYKPGTVVLGPDGNLYRISPTNDARLPSEEVKRTESKKDKRFSGYNQESKENCDEQMLPAKEVEASFEEESSVSSTVLDYMDDDCANHTHEDHIHVDSESNAEQEAIVVEDVDDDEDDELRELHSSSRNRSPSPGQWMEPIDKYDGQHG